MMKHFQINNAVSIAAITFIVLLAGCGQAKVNFKEEEKKITSAWTDWSKKALTGKPDSLAYYYADDALIIGTEPEFIKGKAAVIKMYADAATNFELDIKWDDEQKPNIIHFSNDGSMAYSLDGNAVNMPDAAGTIHLIRNKVLHIWKKDTEGNWSVSLLMVYPQRNK
jgi:ketosteroid isomerase-like protein